MFPITNIPQSIIIQVLILKVSLDSFHFFFLSTLFTHKHFSKSNNIRICDNVVSILKTQNISQLLHVNHASRYIYVEKHLYRRTSVLSHINMHPLYMDYVNERRCSFRSCNENEHHCIESRLLPNYCII